MILNAVLCAFLLQQTMSAGDLDGASPLATEQAVLSTYKRMEEADRKGDGQLWFSLRDRKTLDTMDAGLKASMRKGGHSRPEVRYEPQTVRVSNERAILIGKVVDPTAATTQYQNVLFVVEGGAWKVAREQWSDAPFDPFVLYGLLPPEPGSFARSGAWRHVPYASPNLQTLGKKDVVWKMQATFDEAYLYIRYEWVAELPAPGSRIKPELADTGKTGAPPPPPSMHIRVAADGDATVAPHELTIAVRDVVSTRGAFDNQAKGPANRFFVGYSLYVQNAAGEDVFEYALGNDSTGRLLAVQDRMIEVRIPLGGLGIGARSRAKLQLEEVGSVLRILPYTVERFGK
ncbi:MAG TPA: hypothetical protein VNV86_05615 [Candidatus Acidoferrum sp.]|nr:hypothetical protein [Candidatus Acidoferrum sp.]